MTPSRAKGPSGDEDTTQVTVVPASPADRASDEYTAKTVPPEPPGQFARGSVELDNGLTLNEYRIEGKIGEGGMGAVFSAVHPLIGKRAAIKVLKRELCEDPITLERFIDEARVVNQIGHPNIVDVFAFGTLADGRSYFVMEWLKGESLRDRVERGALHYLEACAILKALARALEAAHEKGVIHRDLKPDNVFLVEERGEVPRVKLLDFGIAKLMRADQSVSRTATGAMIGTPQYVAPEQAKGHAIDARVDIYSLGCVAFELLTGRPPFIADNAMEMVAKHLMEAPPRPSQLVPGLPPELDDIVVEMLAKDREQRPTVTEICATLDTVQRAPARASSSPLDNLGDAISLSVTRPVDISNMVDHVQKRQRRRNLWAALGLVAGGVATGVVAFMVVSSLREPKAAPPPPAAEPAPEPAPAEAPAPAPAPVEEHASPSPSPSPSPPPPPPPVVESPKPHVAAPAPKPKPVHHDKPSPAPAANPPPVRVPDKNDGIIKVKVPDPDNGLMKAN